MTVKQLNELTPADQKIYIGWNGLAQELNRENELELHAFGSYQIAKIYAIKEDAIEADLLAQPVKEEK